MLMQTGHIVSEVRSDPPKAPINCRARIDVSLFIVCNWSRHIPAFDGRCELGD